MSQLILDNVNYRYKNAPRNALSDVSCRFEPGNCYALVGPSGSGKTTLLSIMAGLDAPQDGLIEFNEKSLAEMDLDRYRREDVSMIFQAFHLFPLLTVLENVCYPMELNGLTVPEARVLAKEALISVGIDEEKHKRYPSRLSGGEQQRVAIARALSTGAKLLLADEPTGNLDTENGNNIMDILKGLAHDRGYCIIIVTHDLEIAAQADVVYRMSDGVLELAS